MILLTCAYGNQGRRLLPKLVAQGAKVRAIRSNPEGEPDLRRLGAAEVIIGDLADPATLEKAVTGVESVYFIGPSCHPREGAMGLSAVEIARKVGVGHFVYSSVLHSIASAIVQHKLKREVEERLIQSGLNFTILQPADFMGMGHEKHHVATATYMRFWSLDTKECRVDLDDLTDVAAKVLLEGIKHFGATYELCAEGNFTAFEQGKIIEEVIGRPVEVRRMTEEELENFITVWFGRDKHLDYERSVFASIRSWYSTHDFVGNPNVLTMLLGRKPRTFRDVIQSIYEEMK